MTQYTRYLAGLESARIDLEILCSNCLQVRIRSTRIHGVGSEYSIYGKKYDIKQRQEMMDILDQHECIKCGYNNVLAIEICHKKSWEAKRFRDLFKSKRKELKYYIQNPDKAKEELYILCANCKRILKHNLAIEIVV
jgi:hypothetical protein